MMHNPIAVMKSRNRTDSLVVVTEARDNEDYPVLVAIAMEKTGAGTPKNIINKITTIHGRESFDKTFGYSLKEGKLIKIDLKKARRLPSNYRDIISLS